MNRENNFNVIRVLAACFVFAGHMGLICGGEAQQIGRYNLHQIGVGILFLISGYLITHSWLADPDYPRYLVRRFLRFWPPFAVMVLIMTFIAGPMASFLGWKEYFETTDPFRFTIYLRNLRFYIVYYLPGVFPDLPIAYTVNGSLWTMPVEAFAYLVAPALLFVFHFGKRASEKVSAGLKIGFAVFMVAVDIYFLAVKSGPGPVVYGTMFYDAWNLLTWFAVGMAYTGKAVRRFLNLQAALLVSCALFVFPVTAKPVQYLLMFAVFPYVVFSLAFAPQPRFSTWFSRLDPSYGIYLYGYFFQQLVVQILLLRRITLNVNVCMLLSFLPALASALLSAALIEKPLQKLCKKTVAFMRTKNI